VAAGTSRPSLDTIVSHVLASRPGEVVQFVEFDPEALGGNWLIEFPPFLLQIIPVCHLTDRSICSMRIDNKGT
jgi:hypothetical protein